MGRRPPTPTPARGGHEGLRFLPRRVGPTPPQWVANTGAGGGARAGAGGRGAQGGGGTASCWAGRRSRLPRTAPRGSARRAARNFGMEFVRALWLCLALALGPRPAGGHPQPCSVLARLGGSVRLGALLPRAPAARARVRAALARAALAPRLPHNLSLELVAAAPPARDPASLARGLCQALAAPGVAAVLAFPEARPELLQLHFLAAAAETPVLSVLRREARAPLGAPVRGDARDPDEGGPGTLLGRGGRGCDARVAGAHGTRTSAPRIQEPRPRPGDAQESRRRDPRGSQNLDPWTRDAPRAREPRTSRGTP